MTNEQDPVEHLISLVRDVRDAERDHETARRALARRLNTHSVDQSDSVLVAEAQRLIGQIVMGRQPIAP